LNRRSMMTSLAVLAVPAPRSTSSVYLAGPLFSEAERAFLSSLAVAIRASGHECFVPHEAELPRPATAAWVFQLDQRELVRATSMVAWIDGPDVDSGTACEIGLFSERVRNGQARGIVALSTDLRHRFRSETPGRGVNLFVAGAIESVGVVVNDAAAVLSRLEGWR